MIHIQYLVSSRKILGYQAFPETPCRLPLEDADGNECKIAQIDGGRADEVKQAFQNEQEVKYSSNGQIVEI